VNVTYCPTGKFFAGEVQFNDEESTVTEKAKESVSDNILSVQFVVLGIGGDA